MSLPFESDDAVLPCTASIGVELPSTAVVDSENVESARKLGRPSFTSPFAGLFEVMLSFVVVAARGNDLLELPSLLYAGEDLKGVEGNGGVRARAVATTS